MRALSESERFDLQLALLDKHTRQHADLRKKIHLTTERFVTLMIALTTLVDTDIVHFSYTNATKTVSTVVVTIIMIAIVYMICKDHKSSLKNARIVSSLNEEFGLFSKGKVIRQETLYPVEWRGWGNEPLIKGMILHISIVIIMTAVFLLSLWTC